MTEKILNAVQSAHNAIRNAPEGTFLSRAMQSDDNDPISLPFRLSVQHIHEKTRRGLPYLRQSWNRIDFVAIVSFWIMFGLAMAGVEKGEYHIGLFRAMSVIRTARLLTITSGTTVSVSTSQVCTHRLRFWLDYYAFIEDSEAAINERRVFRGVCNGFILVCTTCRYLPSFTEFG